MHLNLPEHEIKVKKSVRGEGLDVYDPLRRRYVRLTPEEWVRQRFVSWLIEDKGFPPALMGNEVSLVQNGIARRCDTVVGDKGGNPLVIVEYKAPTIAVTQQTFDQIVRYNMVLRARYLMVSNGITHYCCRINYETGSYTFMKEIPQYADLLAGNE